MTNDDARNRLIEVLRRRADRWTSLATADDPSDRADWWHVVWERLGDVAYLHSIEPTPGRAGWLQREVARLCALDPDEWIGPAFRGRVEPSIGTLETAHVGLAVATVLHLCPNLIDVEQIREALVGRCLEPCERALRQREDGHHRMNNWYHVLLDGYGAVALALGDAERMAGLPDRVGRARSLTEPDSYGESVQYWGYATLHLTHLWEFASAYGVELPAVAASVAGCLAWVTQSIMFTGRSSHWGPGSYLTMINFGDSAVTARPPADVLLHLARYAAPAEAGLARWVYDVAYADPELHPTDVSTFGFFNQPTWRSAELIGAAAAARPPDRAELPVTQAFTVGTAILRGLDREQTVLAVQGGHGKLQVGSHRHNDAGSFILGHAGEVIFSDPGHCCYRLPAYQAALAETAHSTWTIRREDETPVPQRSDGETGTLVGPTEVDGCWRVSADIAVAYGGGIRKAERTWLFRAPNLVLVIDDVISDEPVSLDSRFVINNRDGRLSINRATDRRTVLRRNGVAAKFFLLEAWTDSEPVDWPINQHYSTLHDIYDPHPNAPGQGKEGSGADLVFTSPLGRRHRAVYSIVVDAEPRIRSWHVTWTGDGILLGHPDGREETIEIQSSEPVHERALA